MWVDDGHGDKGHYKEKWQRITVGGAECGNWGSDMCVNGATRAAGGADGLHTDGVVSSCTFFVGIECSGGCDGFGGATGGKREEKGKKREDGKGEFE